MDVLVFGAGSLGSLLGGLLAREHEVTLVGREAHVTAVRERGLAIDGAIEAQVRPVATTEATGHDADFAVVAVKSLDTPAAADALSTGTFDAVLSVQNGLGNEATLAAAVDAPVLAGTATYGAALSTPGRVTCTGLGEVALGPRAGGESAVADRVGAAFAAAGVETTVVPDPARRRWRKLAVNAGVNPVTALARVENGALRADGDDRPGTGVGDAAGELARGAARETARVAAAEGVDLDEDTVVAAVDDVVAATAANRSSMLQDVLAGRRTEVDAINGAIVERAAAAGVDVPVTETLAGLVRAWERGQGLR